MVEVVLGRTSPGMPIDKRTRLAEAATKYNLSTIEYSGGITEKMLFDRKYDEIKTLYMAATAGSNPMNMKAVLDMFNEYQPVVEAVIAYFVHEQVKGTLACDVAESNKDVIVRQTCEDTFSGPAVAPKVGPYSQIVATGTGIDYIPSAASVAATGTTTWTATREQQTLIIMGYGEFVSATPFVSRIQETQSDRVGDRIPLEVYMMQAGDLRMMKRNSALWVEDDSTLDIDVTAIANGITGIYPIGVDICTNAQVGVI